MLSFGSLDKLGAAYGIAVTATMLTTTVLTFFVIRYGWRYNLPLCLAATGFFLGIDITLFSANILKILDGDWFPLLLGAVLLIVMLERVLCNLVENAAKYTPPGSSIVISAGTHGTFLEVSVLDNGPGIPVGREEAIFEKFVRGERELATSGVGLGSAICRAIVEAHGGAIHAERSSEGGAAFVFSIPLGTPPAMHDNEPSTNDRDVVHTL